MTFRWFYVSLVCMTCAAQCSVKLSLSKPSFALKAGAIGCGCAIVSVAILREWSKSGDSRSIPIRSTRGFVNATMKDKVYHPSKYLGSEVYRYNDNVIVMPSVTRVRKDGQKGYWEDNGRLADDLLRVVNADHLLICSNTKHPDLKGDLKVFSDFPSQSPEYIKTIFNELREEMKNRPQWCCSFNPVNPSDASWLHFHGQNLTTSLQHNGGFLTVQRGDIIDMGNDKEVDINGKKFAVQNAKMDRYGYNNSGLPIGLARVKMVDLQERGFDRIPALIERFHKHNTNKGDTYFFGNEADSGCAVLFSLIDSGLRVIIPCGYGELPPIIP